MLRAFIPPLLAVISSCLLSACALQPATTTPAATAADPVFRHALVRSAPPMPNWPRLQQTLEATATTGVRIHRIDDGLKVEVPVTDGFASGSSQLQPALSAVLDQLAVSLGNEPGLAITVVGHTDSQGSEMFNLRLSIERAEAVVSHLVRNGLAPERLHADGHGEGEPLASNATEAGRARNRRVELILQASP